jgi:hypothetical protein
MFALPKFKRYRVTIITTLVITAGFALYFFVYVANNAQYLHERAFRVLAQVSQNLDDKHATVLSNARNEIRQRAKEKDLKNKYLKARNNAELEFTQIQDYASSRTKSQFDSREIVTKSDTKRKGKNIQTIDTQKVKPQPDPKTTPELVHTPNGWYVSFQDTVSIDSKKPGKKNTLQISFRMKLSEFIQTALIGQGEVFEEYILLKDSAIIFDTETKGLTIHNTDSLSFLKSSFLSGHVQSIEMSGITYKLFAHRVHLGSNHQLLLGGLIKEKEYRKQIYNVSMLSLMLIVLVLMLLAFGYPFFKLWIMSACETVQLSDAFFTVISLLIGSFMLTLLLFFGFGYWVSDQDAVDKDLTTLSNSIETSFVQELRDMRTQLVAYRDIINQQQFGPNTGSNFIIPPATQLLNYNYLESRHPNQLYAYPSHYPFLTTLFSVRTDGTTGHGWLISDNEMPTGVDVIKRNYFQAIQNGQTWNLPPNHQQPVTKADSVDFMLQPLFNLSTGKNEMALSIALDPIAPREYTSLNKNKCRVLALESEPYSVIDPVLPSGFGFCILDQEGKIWFHSNRQKNLQEQFMKECGEDKALQAALKGDAAEHLDIRYNGNAYRAYMVPLSALPLHLIVFHDYKYYKTTGVMILSMAVLCYLVSMLPLVLLLLLQKLTYRNDHRLEKTHFAFSWLRPNRENRMAYYPLFFLFTLMTVWSFVQVFNPWLSYEGTMVFYALNGMYSFSMAHAFLCHRQGAKNTLKAGFWHSNRLYWIFFTIMIVLLNLIAWPYLEPRERGLILFYEVTISLLSFLLILLVNAYLHQITKHPTSSQPANQYLKKAPFFSLSARYMAFFSSWIFLLGIGPGVVFYQMAYNREQKIATAHSMFQLAESLKKRKENIEKKYQHITVDPYQSTQIRSAIYSKGIYRQQGDSTTIYFNANNSKLGTLKTDSISSVFRLSSLITRLRLPLLYNPIAVENQFLLSATSGKATSNIFHWYSLSDTLQLHYQGYNPARPAQDFLSIAAISPQFLALHWSHTTSFISLLFLGLLFGIICLILYGLGDYAVINLYSLGLFGKHRTLPLKLEPLAEMVLLKKQNLFLTGLRLPHKDHFISDFLRHHSKEVEEINFELVDVNKRFYLKNLTPQACVISHFEEIVLRAEADSFFVGIIEQLIRERIPILIVSCKAPVELRKLLAQSLLQKASALSSEEQVKRLRLTTRWENALNGFQECHYHLNMSYTEPIKLSSSAQEGSVGELHSNNGTKSKPGGPFTKRNKIPNAPIFSNGHGGQVNTK